ncbi:hypothetical protein [Cellulomonas soli]
MTPYQRQMTAPVLVVYGTGDASMPIVQGAEQIITDTAIAGNGDVTVRYYADADHGIRVDGEVSATFLRDLSSWVRALPGSADGEPQIAGAQPRQEYLAAPVPEPRWLRDGDVVLGTVLTAAGLLVLGPLLLLGDRAAEVVRARRRRVPDGDPQGDAEGDADGGAGGVGAADVPTAPHRYARGVARWAAVFGAGAAATVVALVWYLVAIARLAMDYERNAVVVQGGWLVVRGLGIAAVVAGVLLATRIREVQAEGVRAAPGAVRTGALWSVCAGALVLLVVLAYWGAFQLGI